MGKTRIGIIGSGNMGSAFAKRLARAGHDVVITAKDVALAEKAATAAGSNARAVLRNDIGRAADVLILATPYAAATDALNAAGDVNGKTVIDISNPLKPDMSGLVVGHTTSAAEEIQKAFPRAYVVKAFKTIFAPVLGSESDQRKAQVFFAGDNAEGKEAVRAVIESIGFEAVDAGPLANARYLEPLGMLSIHLGYVAGRGTGIGAAFVSIA